MQILWQKKSAAQNHPVTDGAIFKILKETDLWIRHLQVGMIGHKSWHQMWRQGL